MLSLDAFAEASPLCLDFLELQQVLSTYGGDLRDPLWWPQERPTTMSGGQVQNQLLMVLKATVPSSELAEAPSNSQAPLHGARA